MDVDVLICLYYILLLILLSAISLIFRAVIYPFLHPYLYVLWFVIKYKVKSSWQRYFHRPIVIKNNLLKFKYQNFVYQLDLKKAIDPSRLVLTVITDGYKDVSEHVLSIAGPFGNFFGLEVTPRSLGYSCLYVDHVNFYAIDDKLPSLETLVD
jgi:hypothetical protein